MEWTVFQVQCGLGIVPIIRLCAFLDEASAGTGDADHVFEARRGKDLTIIDAVFRDASNGDDLLTLEQGNEYDVTTASFSHDGNRIVAGDGENELKVRSSTSTMRHYVSTIRQ